MSNVSGRAAACQTAAILLNSDLYVEVFTDAIESGHLPVGTDLFKYSVEKVEGYIRTGSWEPSKDEDSDSE